MNVARRIRRKQAQGSKSNLDKALTAVQQIQKVQGSLEGLSDLVRNLEGLQSDLKTLLVENERLNAEVEVIHNGITIILPYIDLPDDIKAQLHTLLEVP
jgi:phosphoglycerate-specific signal transduction histidine kinase